MSKYLCDVVTPQSVITPIEGGVTFPEVLTAALNKYKNDISLFRKLVLQSSSSAELLASIRSSSIPAPQRMSLLKMFRRCVSLVCDTETTKKINTVATASLVENFGHTFKPIETLKTQFKSLDEQTMAALAVLIGEYDTRGQLGYQLTGLFFDWFETAFKGSLSISGPRGAGRDIELSSVFPEFKGGYPCDFVIRHNDTGRVLAVGFARYDSTRGGAQSDDRTGGNSNKVDKARQFCVAFEKRFRLIFLADGPGLAHRDTWAEACELDGAWDGNVRVITLKLAPTRITKEWLMG